MRPKTLQKYIYKFIYYLHKNNMGNDQCHQCKQTIQENQAYGTYQILQQGNKIYALVQKKVQKDPILQKKVLKQLQTRKNIKHSHVVTLHRYSICQTNYGFKVTMIYDFIPRTLRNRIEDLQNRGEKFTERQIFAIIYGIESALVQLSTNDIKHCCINLDTILCKNNFYKLTDVSSTTYLTSYDLVAKGDKQQFLSEKLLGSMMHKSLAPDYTLKDDMFSLGIIALMLCANKTAEDFYIWDSKGLCSINTQTINNCFRYIQKNYSSKLTKKIKSLIFDPQIEQNIKSDKTNLSDSLNQLQQQMSRVLGKVKHLNSTDISIAYNSRKYY